jgi:acyl dehydratase
MPVDPAIVGRSLRPVTYSYTPRDVMLYALGVGAGDTPSDLKFVYENGLQVIPTFGVIPPFPALFSFLELEGVSINPALLLHGEQYLEIKKHPIPDQGRLISRPKVAALYDKGKGALVELEVNTEDENGEIIFYNCFSVFLRGEGGFGGEKGPEPGNIPPNRFPDRTVPVATLPVQALIYRLSGDYNPLHVDPVIATMAGFEKPILHGLSTMGFAARAILREYGSNDPSRFKAMKVRFSRHVFPGETIITEMWQETPDKIVFQSKTAQRDGVCLANAAVWLTV